jgi:hypothetical protein
VVKGKMPRRGEYGDPTPRCAYCGKPEVKVIWSGYRQHYCSFDCMAADQYHCSFLCSLCIAPISILMSVGIFYSYATNPLAIEGSYIPLIALFDTFTCFTVYTTYRGWKIEG